MTLLDQPHAPWTSSAPGSRDRDDVAAAGSGTATDADWVDVCPIDALVPDRGVRALVAGQAVAVFRCSPDDDLYAISDVDPFSGASVLSRGIVGSIGDRAVVASPLFKQRIDLGSGVALDDPDLATPVFAVRRDGGRVQVHPQPLTS